MSLSTKYNPREVEDRWYQHWMDKGFFHAEPNPDKEPFSIVIPPPNVTGVLHMGHMLNNTLQDVLIRKARMQGKEACWVPGTDHASIATEAKVVRMLREQGIKKSDLTRDEFMKHAWEWKEKYGGIILEQLKKLGASCDWDRTAFTMDPEYYDAVIKVFVDLYRKGFIYRGLRMINWDCEAMTALSNEEVIYNENGDTATLYSVRYKIEESDDEYVTIATVRPETIMGDAAIAVNPNDERYKHLLGKHAIVPFVGRAIPIIADSYVDLEFGTGCLKVTPAHDQNDYEIGQRHNLEVIDTINLDGTLNEKCGVPAYVGKDRFVVRKMVVKDLEAAGHLVGSEDFTTRIGRSERTNTVVEPKLSLQWFINMQEISKRALSAVVDDEVQLHPSKFKNTYIHWMENVRDWCISRQLWWGQRIPAYFYGDGDEDFVVAASIDEALELAKAATGNADMTADDLRQDSDVLDTWASSWLFPIEVFKGFGEGFDKKEGKIKRGINADLDYFYPTSVLVTAPEILFFWVARMIIAGYEYMDEKPFENVYLTGIVRDKQRRKMSKSLGNSPDPLDLIAQYGADGVRTGMLFSSPAGNDLLFDEKLVEQGRNFSNKIWNAFRLVTGWEVAQGARNEENEIAIKWFESRFQQAFVEIEDHFSKYRISDALMATYKLVWDDFCSWYLEMIKPAYGQPIDEYTLKATRDFFEKVLKILHPFMPFITEELWHQLADRTDKDCLIIATWPKAAKYDAGIIQAAEEAFEIVSAVRNLRNEKGISMKEALPLSIHQRGAADIAPFAAVIKKLSNLERLDFSQEAPQNAISFVVRTNECHVTLAGLIDTAKESEELRKEITYLTGFKNNVEKKLSNERFVNNAPEQVVAMEKKKLEDAIAKIKSLEDNLAKLAQ